MAYMQRQQWLAKLQAIEIVNALGRAMGGKGQAASPQIVPLDTLMAQMGTTWS